MNKVKQLLSWFWNTPTGLGALMIILVVIFYSLGVLELSFLWVIMMLGFACVSFMFHQIGDMSKNIFEE